MSDSLAALLPPEFLTADDTPIMPTKPLFPTPFRPYEFASYSSTESESDDDDISALTRRFTRSSSLHDHRLKTPYPQKKRVFSGSPESTLSWDFSGRTPFVQDDVAWDLIYAAAGEVARMKMRLNNVNDDVFARSLLLPQPPTPPPPPPPQTGPPVSYHHHHHHPNCTVWRKEREEFLRHQQFRYRLGSFNGGGGGGRCGSARPVAVGFRPSAWPPLPLETHRRQHLSNGFAVKPVLAGSATATGLKKQCAGTGVFLPRRFDEPPEPKKKPANLPARMAQPMNKNMGTMKAQMNINGGRKCEAAAEVVLPQEWTY